ncbi:MAG: hypothetical protein EBV07_00710 [Proteobacteria bacterium]|nr:hypothetical protein [Pseudomonadota bacterium]
MLTLNVLAATADNCKIFNGSGCTNFNQLILEFVLPSMQAVTIGIAIIYLLYGAIQYILAAGDEKASKVATGALTNAAIGMVIALLIVVIIQVLQNILGGPSQATAPSNLIPGSSQ